MTLIEVILSMSILAVAALAIIATVTRVMLAQSTSSHHTVARILAESLLQEAALAGPPDWGRDGPETTRSATVGQNDEPTTFTLTIEEHPIPKTNEDGHAMFHASGSSMGTLYELKVNVWWNNEDGPRAAVERGTESLTVSKLVYHEE